jgi:hypothetical protein
MKTSSILYSNEENELLIRDLEDHQWQLKSENFCSMEEIWEGLFGVKRTAYNLHVHSKEYAEKLGHKVQVVDIPKRIRKPNKKRTSPNNISIHPQKGHTGPA